MHISLGITSSSGVLAVSGLTLPPGDYIISVGAFGYEIKEYPYIVTMEKYEAVTIAINAALSGIR